MDTMTILIIAGAALVAGVLAGALWVMIRKVNELSAHAAESLSKYWMAKKELAETKSRANSAEHDARELQRRNDEMITKGIGSTSAVMLFDLAQRKHYAERERTAAEIGALKAAVEKANREAEAAKSFIAGMEKGAAMLHEKIAELEAQLAEKVRVEPAGNADEDAVMGVLEKFAGELDIAVVDTETGEAVKFEPRELTLEEVSHMTTEELKRHYGEEPGNEAI